MIGSSREDARARFESSIPILRVANLAFSLAHYRSVLGFAMDWQSPATIASVSRDRCGLFLAQGDQGNPGTWVWIGVDDVTRLFEEYRASGAKIRHPPTNYPWAYEMQVEDPDGNVIRFGAEAREGEPTGPWRDMKGHLWVRTSEGSWTRSNER